MISRQAYCAVKIRIYTFFNDNLEDSIFQNHYYNLVISTPRLHETINWIAQIFRVSFAFCSYFYVIYGFKSITIAKNLRRISQTLLLLESGYEKTRFFFVIVEGNITEKKLTAKRRKNLANARIYVDNSRKM